MINPEDKKIVAFSFTCHPDMRDIALNTIDENALGVACPITPEVLGLQADENPQIMVQINGIISTEQAERLVETLSERGIAGFSPNISNRIHFSPLTL